MSSIFNFVIPFPIVCGEKTCGYGTEGDFCQYCRIDGRGRGVCHLFGPLGEKDGWIQRHKDCLTRAVFCSEKR